MKIDLITRVQYEDLYHRMSRSAVSTAKGDFGCLYEQDKVNLPKVAETYNRLARKSKADILCFVHDDVTFLSKNWDVVIKDIFKRHKPDIVGVIGATEYWGGQCFDAGYPYLRGVVAGEDHYTHRQFIKIVSTHSNYFKVKVVDALIMFIDRKFILKHKFDEVNFDQLYFIDIDICLRAKKVGVTCDILVKHYKDLDRYDHSNMKQANFYLNIMHTKHNINPRPARTGNDCCMVDPSDFHKYGQTMIYKEFEKQLT